MRKYELLLVLPGTLDEKEAEVKTKEVMDIINESCQEVDLSVLGKNRLAYPIKQVRYGYFYTVIFSAEPDIIKMIEEKLKLCRGLLRAIVTHFNKAMVGSQKITYFNNEVPQEEQPRTVVVDRTEPEIEVERVQEQAVEAVEPVKEEAIEAEPEKIIIPKAPAKVKTLDLKEIDKKLDEILADDNINI